MKRRAAIFLMFLFIGLSVRAANDDNRPIGAMDVRSLLKQADDKQVIWVSTTIPADTDVQILPDHYVYYGTSMTWPSGITFSTNPATSNGGRLFWGFQALQSQNNESTTQRLYWSFNTTVATMTAPYVYQGGWFPPSDWPFVYQGTVTVRSTNTFRLGGVIITEKGR